MYVLAVHFHGRSVRRFGEPDVEILAFSRLEEHDIVAVVQIGELVQLVQLGFSVEFSIFAAMRKECVQVAEEMAMSGEGNVSTFSSISVWRMRIPIGYASGCQDENSLAVLGFTFAVFIACLAVGFALGHGFVY